MGHGVKVHSQRAAHASWDPESSWELGQLPRLYQPGLLGLSTLWWAQPDLRVGQHTPISQMHLFWPPHPTHHPSDPSVSLFKIRTGNKGRRTGGACQLRQKDHVPAKEEVAKSSEQKRALPPLLGEPRVCQGRLGRSFPFTNHHNRLVPKRVSTAAPPLSFFLFQDLLIHLKGRTTQGTVSHLRSSISTGLQRSRQARLKPEVRSFF